MQPIDPEALSAQLTDLAGESLYLHLETTRGAYTKNTYGAFARNVQIRYDQAGVAGSGPYRVGLRLSAAAGGWVVAEGLTHWQLDPGGRLLLAGHDDEGRLTVALQLSREPFSMGLHGENAGLPSDDPGPPAASRLSTGDGGADHIGGRSEGRTGDGDDGPATDADRARTGDGHDGPATDAGRARTGYGDARDGRDGTARDTDPLAGERHLLVVLAHPDDEAFGCTGVMTILRRRGVPVTYVCATMGQMGRLMGRPPFATRESLAALRRRELAEAMRIVGVDDVHLLGLWDKTVEFEDPDALADRIAAIISELHPSTVITFHPEHSGHPDHHAVGRATLIALDRAAVDPPPRVWMPAIRSDELNLDLAIQSIDIAAVSDVKRAAFAAHRSQTMGWEERLASSEKLRRRFEWMFREERFWVWS